MDELSSAAEEGIVFSEQDEGGAGSPEEIPAEQQPEAACEDSGQPELLYAEDAAPGRNLKEVIRAQAAAELTEQDRKTLMSIKDLAAETPAMMENMLRNEKLPAMAKIRLIEIILDRAYGKATETVNVNAAGNGIEASEMRVEALVRSIRVEGNPYGEN